MYENDKIPKENIEDVYELTPLQQGILFQYLSEPNNNVYVQQLRVDISGYLSMELFKEAWLRVYQCNEIMRSIFRWEKLKKPIQVILKEKAIDIRYIDATDKMEKDREGIIQRLINEDQEEKIDLLKSPHRIILCKFSADINIMIMICHHIIIDGWSQGQLIKEFFEEYELLSRDQNHSIRKTKPKYKTYIQWLRTQEKEKDKSFWSKYLKDYTQTSTLLGLNDSSVGKKILSYRSILSDEFNEQLKVFCKNNKITIAQVIYAAWALLLCKYNDYDDILFGTTVSGRTVDIKGINEMVGLFISTPPLRIKMNENQTVEDLVFAIKLDLEKRNMFTHVSLTDIKDYSGIRDQAPLFNSIVVVENYPVDFSLMNTNETLTVKDHQSFEHTNFPLVLTVEVFKKIQFSLQCRSDDLEQYQIEKCLEHLLIIIEQMIQNKQLKLSEINMISLLEKNKVIQEFNNTTQPFSEDITIDQLFEKQVEETPDNMAIIEGDNKMTYRQVSDFSNQWARILTNKMGTKSEEIIGLFMGRTIHLIPTVLAIHKTGSAYLPLDPLFPSSRLQYMISDTGIKTIMTLRKYLKVLKELLNEKNDMKIICVDDFLNDNRFDLETIEENRLSKRKPSNLAYVMYTSGSTGKPKGVTIEHHSVINRLEWMSKHYLLSSEDVFLQKTQFTFDVSVWELFLWFFCGACVCILPEGGEKEPDVLVQTIKNYKVSIIHFVPSMMNGFLQHLKNEGNITALSSLKRVIVSGETLLTQQAKLFTELLTNPLGVKLSNLYGPTEATIDVTYYDYEYDDNFDERIPIGKPIDNTSLYILDKYGMVQPIGVIGELWIAGRGLARGYLNQPELTRERFKELPFFSGTRMYRTGDLARWKADGNIEYWGRNDYQVKVRGFRIELGEIEHKLLQDTRIQEAAVVVKQDKRNINYITAYYVSKEEASEENIREFLKQSLPAYMIPTYIFKINQMPLTVSGKLDRKSLQLKENDVVHMEVREAPSNEMEKKLAELFKEVLTLSEVGVTDNYFSIGGHSLNALTLISLIHKTLKVKIPISELYKYPTIRELAKCISTAKPKEFVSIKRIKPKEYYPLSASQSNIFVLQQANTENMSYNMPFAVAVKGKLCRKTFVNTLRKLVMRHEALRTSMVWINDQPMQKVNSYAEPQIIFKNITGDNIYEDIHNWLKPFNLFEAPLFRAALFNVDEYNNICVFDLHHIVSDGISIDILINDFCTLYQGRTLSDVTIQYMDYVMWQKEMLNSEEMKEQEKYWLSIYNNGFPSTARLFDQPDRLIGGNQGNKVIQKIERELYHRLMSFSQQKSTTLFVVLLSAYYILLSKYSTKEDIVIGIPTGGRAHGELQNVVGLLVNTLVLRNRPYPNKKISDFISEVKQTVVHGIENQDFPLLQLLSRLQVERKDRVIPLFSCMFTMSDMNSKNFNIDELEFRIMDIKNKEVKFDLTLELTETADDLFIMFEYAEDIFSSNVIETMIKHYIDIIAKIIELTDMTIAEVNIVSETNEHPESIESGINDLSKHLQAEFEL